MDSNRHTQNKLMDIFCLLRQRKRAMQCARACGWSLALGACGGHVLDLGSDFEPPHYATTETAARDGLPGSGGTTVMATHQYSAVAVAVDETRVYWAMRGYAPPTGTEPSDRSAMVRSCVKADCAATVVTYAAVAADAHVSIAISKTEVYWAATLPNTVIQACAIEGCTDIPRVVAADVWPHSLVVDDAFAYWLSFDATLQRCPIEGCERSPELLTLVGPTQGALAQDATQLYWSVGQTGPDARGTIMTIPKDGSSPSRTVVDGWPTATALAVDTTNIYWVETDALGAVKSCPRTGCVGEPITLASRQPFPHWLAIDGESAYWFNLEERLYIGKDIPGQLVRCPLTGCGTRPVVLASDQIGPFDITVDGTHVYWASFGEKKFGGRYANGNLGMYFDGAIMRARIKP
jgi:hypothetical protein